jgi:hypothetical protein
MYQIDRQYEDYPQPSRLRLVESQPKSPWDQIYWAVMKLVALGFAVLLVVLVTEVLVK